MPETTITECVGDPSRHDPILSPSANTEMAGMLGKLSISRNSNAEESDASSEDGGSEATGTVQSLERVQYNQSISTESSSSMVRNVSWTNEDRDQERELRSRSSSECSDSSSANSDSTPAKCDEENKDLEIQFDKLKIVQGDDSQQKVVEISEQDVDSNCEQTTDDSDDESSPEENQESEDLESETDGEEFTTRSPMTSDSKRSPPHLSKPYDHPRNQNLNLLSRDRGDYYSQESRNVESNAPIELISRGPITRTTRTHNVTPYNIPDTSVGGSPAENEGISEQDHLRAIEESWRNNPEKAAHDIRILQSFVTTELTEFGPVQTQTNKSESSEAWVVEDVPLFDVPIPSPLMQQGYMQSIRQSSPSIGSTSPVSMYSSEIPSPENVYEGGFAPGIEGLTELLGGMDNSRSPTSDPSVTAGVEWSSPFLMNDSQDQFLPVLQSTSQLGTTPGTGVFNGGRVTVLTHSITSMPEGQDQHTLNMTDNSNGAELLPWHEIISLNDMTPRVPEPVIPTTVRDIDNTRDESAECEKLLRSLDIRLTRFIDVLKRYVSLQSLRSNAHYLLGRKDEEFSAKNDKGNTFAMVMLSRGEDRILERLARLVVTLEKMQRVPESFEVLNLCDQDLLYMAAINSGRAYPFITGLVLQKTFKALGANSEIWRRTYDLEGNTLLHMVIIKGQDYSDVLRELLDIRTTGDQAVFDVLATNVNGQTPWDLAVAADNRGIGNYTSITQLLENYRTPIVIGRNIVGNMTPNIPYNRQL